MKCVRLLVPVILLGLFADPCLANAGHPYAILDSNNGFRSYKFGALPPNEASLRRIAQQGGDEQYITETTIGKVAVTVSLTYVDRLLSSIAIRTQRSDAETKNRFFSDIVGFYGNPIPIGDRYEWRGQHVHMVYQANDAHAELRLRRIPLPASLQANVRVSPPEATATENPLRTAEPVPPASEPDSVHDEPQRRVSQGPRLPDEVLASSPQTIASTHYYNLSSANYGTLYQASNHLLLPLSTPVSTKSKPLTLSLPVSLYSGYLMGEIVAPLTGLAISTQVSELVRVRISGDLARFSKSFYDIAMLRWGIGLLYSEPTYIGVKYNYHNLFGYPMAVSHSVELVGGARYRLPNGLSVGVEGTVSPSNLYSLAVLVGF